MIKILLLRFRRVHFFKDRDQDFTFLVVPLKRLDTFLLNQNHFSTKAYFQKSTSRQQNLFKNQKDQGQGTLNQNQNQPLPL